MDPAGTQTQVSFMLIVSNFYLLIIQVLKDTIAFHHYVTGIDTIKANLYEWICCEHIPQLRGFHAAADDPSIGSWMCVGSMFLLSSFSMSLENTE